MKARSFFDAGDPGDAPAPDDADAATTDGSGSVPDAADTAEAASNCGSTGLGDGNAWRAAASHTGVTGTARLADKEAWLLDSPPPATTRVHVGTSRETPGFGVQRTSPQSPAAPRHRSKRVWLSRQPASHDVSLGKLGNRVVSADPTRADVHDARQQRGAEHRMHHDDADPGAAHGPAIEVVEGVDINQWPAHVVREVRSALQQVGREIGPRLRQEGERFAVLLVMLAAIVVLGTLWGGGTLLLQHGFARGGSAGSSRQQGGTAAGQTTPQASSVVPDTTAPARTGTSTSAATATPAQAPAGVKALKGSILITNTSSVSFQNVIFVSTIGQFSPLWTCSNQPNSVWDVDLAPGASLMVTCLVVGSPSRALPATLAPHAFHTTEENADGTARVDVDNPSAFVLVTLS